MLLDEARRSYRPRQELYAELRAASPLLNERNNEWVLSRYSHVREACRNFSNVAKSAECPIRRRDSSPESREVFYGLFRLQMDNQDEPYHSDVRCHLRVLSETKFLEHTRPFVADQVGKLFAAVKEKGEVDFVKSIAQPLPEIVLRHVFGLDERAYHDLSCAADAVLSQLECDSQRLSEARAEQFVELVVACVSGPLIPGSLFDRLRQSEALGRLGKTELSANVLLLLGAGRDTVTNLLGNMTLALLCWPHELERMSRDPSHIGAVIEETLRFDSPIQSIKRSTHSGTIVGGVEIPKGSVVNLLVGAANLDPDVFEHAERFDPQSRRPHLAFGVGGHHCIGAALARLQATVVALQLPGLLGSMCLAAPVRRRQGVGFSALEALHLRRV
ncbi:cytochrome P450 [Archangium violaceum]|uniref:cytochrome P450 n=1 Tax=Archangium violaceum TaxID=83451 RepID=UPI0036DC1E14